MVITNSYNVLYGVSYSTLFMFDFYYYGDHQRYFCDNHVMFILEQSIGTYYICKLYIVYTLGFST